MKAHLALAVSLLAAGCLAGQGQPVTPSSPEKRTLENSGKPMQVDFQCTEEQIQNFGLSCTIEEPCAVYLELAGLEVAAGRILLAGNFHTESTTLASILLASEDGGRTWNETHARIPAGALEHIQFVDPDHGWVSGQILTTFPRNPFFLVTSNGGKTWRRRPVSTEDDKIGTVEKFFFDTKTSGMVVIDRVRTGDSGGRHELYETMTGGESWMLREVTDRPIELKRAAPRTPNPDWRLRADAATKSFRLEHREAGKWVPAASFLVKVADCRPPEYELREPPEPEETPRTDAVEEFRLGVPLDQQKKSQPRKK